MQGNVKESLTVRPFSFLKPMQERKLPSFFCTSTTFEKNDFFMAQLLHPQSFLSNAVWLPQKGLAEYVNKAP